MGNLSLARQAHCEESRFIAGLLSASGDTAGALACPGLSDLWAQTKNTNKLALGLGESEVVHGHSLGSPGEHRGCLPGRDT